jgi:hypothetical protein
VFPGGVLDTTEEDYRQQYVNAYYHALHPGSHAPFLAAHWQAATQGAGSLKEFGGYLHYLQDIFSHDGYTSPKCGHGCKDQHLPDHTRTDVEKTLRAAKATWKAIDDFAQQKCGCQHQDWNPEWDDRIRRFAEVGYPFEVERRMFEGSDENLLVKKLILGVPLNY